MLESQKPQTAKILIKAAGRLFLTDPKDICYATIEDGVITVATSGHAGMEGHSNCRTLEELFEISILTCSGGRTALFWSTSITSAKLCPGSRARTSCAWMTRDRREFRLSRAQTRRLRELFNL